MRAASALLPTCGCKKVAQALPPSNLLLPQHHQHIPSSHRIAVTHPHFHNLPTPQCLHLVLHLHRFHHHQALPNLHRIPFAYQHSNHFALHRRDDILSHRSSPARRPVPSAAADLWLRSRGSLGSAVKRRRSNSSRKPSRDAIARTSKLRPSSNTE